MTFIRVVVPCDCEKGYTFLVEVDGRIGEVTCPRTVTSGETIEVDAVLSEGPIAPTLTLQTSVCVPCAPQEDQFKNTTFPTTTIVASEIATTTCITAPAVPVQVPYSSTTTAAATTKGDFQYTLCSCCDDKTCCRPIWWNVLLLQCIPVSQLLNRFRWNACVTVADERQRAVTCTIVVGIYIMVLICLISFRVALNCPSVFYLNSDDDSIDDKNDDDDYNFYDDNDDVYTCYPSTFGWVMGSLGSIFFLYIIILLVRKRIQFRDYYNIPGNCFSDFCTMFWCSCCATIQMLRQTHIESIYPYQCCNCLTGLSDDIPDTS